MQRALTCLAIVVLALAGVRAQHSLTGKWQGETPNGLPLTLDLTATGTDLTGTLTRADQTVKITDGKVTNNTFSFKATLGDQPESLSGEFTADEIKIWLDRQGPERAVIMKRVKG